VLGSEYSDPSFRRSISHSASIRHRIRSFEYNEPRYRGIKRIRETVFPPNFQRAVLGADSIALLVAFSLHPEERCVVSRYIRYKESIFHLEDGLSLRDVSGLGVRVTLVSRNVFSAAEWHR